MDLRVVSDWVIRPRLLKLPGIAEVLNIGGDVKESQVLLDPTKSLESWVRAAALQVAARLKAPGLDSAVDAFLSTAAGSGFSATGQWSLRAIRGEAQEKEVRPMLLIEKVITLKAVEMFARTPEDVLADVAAGYPGGLLLSAP